ncbi:MAG: hypothetical protein Q8L39_13190 [Burkholderiales bacterium]|nr:hypothetical protein [Burkholderiales bacterium]
MLEKNHMPPAPEFPSITIPEDCQEDYMGFPMFKLESVCGGIQVHCHWRGLECDGNFESLAAYGLLRADWLPGIPGNNKLRQTIIFGDDGPRLVIGNRRGSKITPSHIVIVRKSARRYVVIVSLTADQNKFLDEYVEERRRRENEKQMQRESQIYAYKPQSPGEVRHDCLRLFYAAMSVNNARLAESGFHYDQDSKDRINKAYGELRRALAEGGIVQGASGLTRDGNVVYLNHPPKR